MPMNIATVIVNWNKKTDVLDLLNDLSRVQSPSFDIFVVDNASTDGSPDAIRSAFPNVNLIINLENLGGTGGFNTGIDHILQRGGYDYIWLLDNDAKIKDDTLLELVDAMKSDDSIGMVGSQVKDIDNREMTVELGAHFRWDIMGTTPVARNTANTMEQNVEVDYVAICSALVAVKAIKKVGLMDHRLFLFWDDMEWGIWFKRYCYKVLAAPKSIVYHASFTERDRGAATNYYYGIRNPLLVYTKLTSFAQRAGIFYRSLRHHCRIYFFLKSQSKTFEAALMYKALSDFMNNKWGKLSAENVPNNQDQSAIDKAQSSNHGLHVRKIMIPSHGLSVQDCQTIIATLKKDYQACEITILVQDDRLGYFKEHKTRVFHKLKASNIFYVLKEAIGIKRESYDAIAYVKPTPFIYLGKRAMMFNNNGALISVKHTNVYSLIKLFLLICYSELDAIFTLPRLLYKSLQYKN